MLPSPAIYIKAVPVTTLSSTGVVATFQAQDAGIELVYTWYEQDGITLLPFGGSPTAQIIVEDPNRRKYFLTMACCAANSTTSYITGTQHNDFPIPGRYEQQPEIVVSASNSYTIPIAEFDVLERL